MVVTCPVGKHFSVSPRPLGFGFLGFGAKGFGPGLDNWELGPGTPHTLRGIWGLHLTNFQLIISGPRVTGLNNDSSVEL